ncbi:MAG: transposase, partial [Gemmatimonadetes bacterium]|nr:transposase [Gemmatimonadota bacterium]
MVGTLCSETVSASTVSRATKRLDAALAEWRTRRVDVGGISAAHHRRHYKRIRREGRVLSTAVLWVLGVAANGYREYLGVWVGNAEVGPSGARSSATCTGAAACGVQYVVSDEHAGLRLAVPTLLPRAVHQRCQVLPAECARQGEHARAPGRRSRRLAGCLGRPHPGHGGAARGNAHPDAAPTLPPSLSGWRRWATRSASTCSRKRKPSTPCAPPTPSSVSTKRSAARTLGHSHLPQRGELSPSRHRARLGPERYLGQAPPHHPASPPS